ncbi:MAG: thiamine phosphate synthase [Bacteroidetes bacterium]|nr:MAG: thiamine phosphate synthase [Bacteroidota bacterium]
MIFNKLERLIYILPDSKDQSFLTEKTLQAISNGVKWIQLRIKNIDSDQLLEIARNVKQITDHHQVKLTINDNPFVAKSINAYGVHVGLNDMPVKEVRKILGQKKIIGGTANTWEDVIYQISQGADYIGLGPLRFTTTKNNLSPVLGMEGYKAITEKLRMNKKNIPVFAIGGIQPKDVVNLLKNGVYGVAVSSAITENPEIAKEFLKKTKECL